MSSIEGNAEMGRAGCCGEAVPVLEFANFQTAGHGRYWDSL